MAYCRDHRNTFFLFATQPGLAADGASRPQDRRDFETRKQLDRLPDLSVRRG